VAIQPRQMLAITFERFVLMDGPGVDRDGPK
jgi:hypothetical protein